MLQPIGHHCLLGMAVLKVGIGMALLDTGLV